MEWPPRSGKMRQYPEADRAEWFTLEAARQKLPEGQRPLLDELAAFVNRGLTGPSTASEPSTL